MRRVVAVLLLLAGLLGTGWAGAGVASAVDPRSERPGTPTASGPLLPWITAREAAPAQAAAPPTQAPTPVEVLVVGVAGLRWSDVGPATPTLSRLAREGATGALSVKAVPAVSCPADGWLTLGAGSRAVAPDQDERPCTGELPAVDDDLPQPELEGTELGALAQAVYTTPFCVKAEGPGAGLVLAGVRGTPVRLGRTPCELQVRELSAVQGRGTGRVADTARLDRQLSALLRDLAPRTLLLVGLSEAEGDRTAQLHVALATGPSFPPGALRSASTRRAPYVQLVDVAPTVLSLLGIEPPEPMTGEPWRSIGEPVTVDALADRALLAEVQKDATVPFFVVLLSSLAVLLLALRKRRELLELVALGGVGALAGAYLAGLVPWWRSAAPLLTLLAIAGLVGAAVAGAAARTRGPLRPAGTACAAVALVLVTDLLTGAHLQVSSVAGYSPLVAGRFAGLGNVAFGVLAASALLATAALVRQPWAVALVGALVVAVDGAPPFGSDVGGVLALVPAFALLVLHASGRRASLPRLALAGAAGVAVVTAFALADWSRAEQDRTHLGRFVQDVADGTAGTLLRRKADAVLDLLFQSPVTALLPFAVALAVFVVVRPLRGPLDGVPAWRTGLASVGLASLVGFAVNDSGAAVPALALVVAVPATVAVLARRAPSEVPGQ